MLQTHPILDSAAAVSAQHFSNSDPRILYPIIKKTQPSMKAGPTVVSIAQKGWKSSSSSYQNQTLMVHSFEIPTVQVRHPLRAKSQALGCPTDS